MKLESDSSNLPHNADWERNNAALTRTIDINNPICYNIIVTKSGLTCG